jgi:hypothetical protein
MNITPDRQNIDQVLSNTTEWDWSQCPSNSPVEAAATRIAKSVFYEKIELSVNTTSEDIKRREGLENARQRLLELRTLQQSYTEELNRLLDGPQEVRTEDAEYLVQIDDLRKRLSNLDVWEQDLCRCLAVLEPLQRHWNILSAFEDAGEKAKLAGDLKAVDSLISRSMNPKSHWDERHRDELLVLAYWPKLLGWRFKALNLMRTLLWRA